MFWWQRGGPFVAPRFLPTGPEAVPGFWFLGSTLGLQGGLQASDEHPQVSVMNLTLCLRWLAFRLHLLTTMEEVVDQTHHPSRLEEVDHLSPPPPQLTR